MLLHYVAANGVEDHRQRTPPNAPAVLALLLESGAEVDAMMGSYGGGPAQTPLALLVSSGHPAAAGVQGELVELLCRAGARADGLDDDGVPLATAAAFRCDQAVAALARHARLDNPLFAAAAGRLDLLQAMLDEQGHARPDAGYCRVPWLHMLRDPRGVGLQALRFAAQFGHLELVRWLLERGLPANELPRPGSSALHEAAFGGHVEVVRLLLDHGARADERDPDHRASAFGWAAEGRRTDVLELLRARCEPEFFDAVDLGWLDAVEAHLGRDRSLANAREGKGEVLRYAAFHGDEGLVRLLLAHGADRSLADGQGRTALALAREHGHAAVVSLLELPARP